jgi:hypothetical protein
MCERKREREEAEEISFGWFAEARTRDEKEAFVTE